MVKSLFQIRLFELLYGLSTRLPAHNLLKRKGTGGTDMSAYCYSVWLRHMVMAQQNNLNTNPQVVAELGPGDSLGIGLTALIFGAEEYHAFDVVEFADIKKNLSVFDEIVMFAQEKRNIPDENEFPAVKPYLDNYSFPHAIFPKERLNKCLEPKRLEKIRKSILNPHRYDSVIRYVVPWASQSVQKKNTVDLIFSQAVLEHVDDLKSTYQAMYDWLGDGGYLSHQIDFKSHGTSKNWNGHWLYPEVLWNLIKGKRLYLLNRQPYSVHKLFLKQEGFSIIRVKKVQADSVFSLEDVNKQFQNISEEDLHTCGAYILATK